MRVTNVEMYSPTLEEPIDFSLRGDDPRARYKVRQIIGLDAEEIIPKFYGWGLNAQSYSESRFYSFNMNERVIVMRIVLNPQFQLDESYSDIRDELYRAISATRAGKIDLHFKSGATTVSHIYGLITRFEAPYFSKTPEVQLTISCEDPMFRALNPVIYSPSELPTTNPVRIADSLSTSPHGFEMQMTFDGALDALVIQDEATLPNWKFTVTPSTGFLIGDVLHFSSEYSSKHLYLQRGQNTIQLVDKISPSSVWPIIFPGDNNFHFVGIDKFNWDTLNFYASYWGV